MNLLIDPHITTFSHFGGAITFEIVEIKYLSFLRKIEHFFSFRMNINLLVIINVFVFFFVF